MKVANDVLLQTEAGFLLLRNILNATVYTDRFTLARVSKMGIERGLIYNTLGKNKEIKHK